MKAKLSSIIPACVLGASALLAGCGKQPGYHHMGDGYYLGAEETVKMGFRQQDIKMKDKHVPVHPDDAGFLWGDTSVNASGKYNDSFLAFKTTGLAGIRNAALTGGLELRFNTGHPKDNDKFEEPGDYMYDWKKQSSDTRDDSESAYCFDKINPGIATLTPSIGVRLFPKNNLQFDVEYGVPFSSIERTSGHHRYGEEDPIDSEKDYSFGQKVGASVTYLIEKDAGISLGYEREWTHFGSVADVTSNNFFLTFTLRF